MKTITAEIAREYITNSCINLGECETLDAETARVLAGQRSWGILKLSGLTSLSDATAAALADHKGCLCLDGLTALADEAAQALGRHRGILFLSGLVEISTAAASGLANHRGPLGLDGLKELSDAAAAALSGHRGYLLLDRLDAASAAKVTGHEGDAAGIARGRAEIRKIEKQYERGIITEEEMLAKKTDVWPMPTGPWLGFQRID